MFSRLLVAYDGSPGAHRALETAVELQTQVGAGHPAQQIVEAAREQQVEAAR